jgi:PAS domain S-box-containing protein
MTQHPNTDRDHISAEQAQAQSEALFNSIGDGAISTDEFGKITRINPVGLKILGYTEQDLLGEWFPKKIVALNERDQPINLIDRPITRAFLTGQPVSEKMHYRKQNGEILPVSISISPILFEGKPIGAIEVFRDITIEEEIDRMKSEFISLASHQLRTPLSAIKTYSHMLVDGYMGETTTAQKKSLRTIITATNRMNELISTLLNITRIESGTIAVSPKNIHIYRACEEVIKELDLAASEKSISLILKKKGTPTTTVKTDNLIIKEIITNLVSNAIKYTSESGQIEVTVQGKTRDVLFTVRDNGWGIPKESHNQVFTKFFRAQNTVKRETTGTGLGLYLVKGLLERLGGKIWFESEEGVGTIFYVSLPRSSPTLRPSKSA